MTTSTLIDIAVLTVLLGAVSVGLLAQTARWRALGWSTACLTLAMAAILCLRGRDALGAALLGISAAMVGVLAVSALRSDGGDDR